MKIIPFVQARLMRPPVPISYANRQPFQVRPGFRVHDIHEGRTDRPVFTLWRLSWWGRLRIFFTGHVATVIWRDCSGWTKEDFVRDKLFVAEHKLTEGADEIFVNGDSVIPGARSLDGVFKARMFAPVGA